MKILIGPSRSGTTFYYNWFLNEYAYDPLPVVQKQGETFTPGYDWRVELGIANLTPDIIKKETQRRLKWLNQNSIVKVTMSAQVDDLFWKYVKDKSVTLIERNNIFEQVISWGVAKQTNKWAVWNPQELETVEFNYPKSWFNEIADELVKYNDMKNNYFTNIEQILYYDDIKNYKVNGRLPIKQKTDYNITNIQEVKTWCKELRDAL